VCRPRRPSHARDELGPELGFCGADAYQGRLAQVRAGIGRGEVGDGDGGRRCCMQQLGFARGSHRRPTSTATASSPAANRGASKVRAWFRWREGVL
jgi:hypothetical protein